ncbi:MAG: hypothetical protein SGPRY_007572 [Prymnesium sp.]
MEEQESDDILQWELDQLEKLKELATVAAKRGKPLGQLSSGKQMGKKFVNFTTARSMLGTEPHSKWLNDREAQSGRLVIDDQVIGDE